MDSGVPKGGRENGGIARTPNFCRSRGEPMRDAIAPLNPTKVSLFTMILYNSENNIRDIRPFCRPLFCHSSVVKYTSSLLQ